MKNDGGPAATDERDWKICVSCGGVRMVIDHGSREQRPCWNLRNGNGVSVTKYEDLFGTLIGEGAKK